MKKIYILLISFMGLFSCSLERVDYTQIYPENFYKNEADVKAAVTAAYHKFHVNTHGGGGIYSCGRGGVNIFTEMCTDVMDCQWEDGGTWWMYHTHSWTASTNDYAGNIYANYNSLSQFRDIVLNIQRSNVVESVKQKYIAEVTVLRGWLMYVLYDLYGPVPVADDATISGNAENAKILPRPSDDEYVKLMVDEFISAINNPALPDKSEEWGRVNRGVANMMLLKVYMKIGNWEEAEKVAREVTNKKYGYYLMNNYYDCFSKATEVNKENIWSIPCDNENYVNGWVTHVLPGSYPYANEKAEAWNGYRMPWDFYKTYEQGDKRLENIIGEYTSKDGKILNKDNPGSDLVKGALPLKYTVDPDQIGDKSGIDIPILRYSDALLSLSECIVRNGGIVTQEAMDLVNDVRERAGLSPLNLSDYASLDKYYDMLLLERGHELYCEGHRRTDLIRFGKFIEFNRRVSGSQTEEYKVLYPIANKFIIEGQGVVLNNKGY